MESNKSSGHTCPLCSSANVVNIFVKDSTPYYKCRNCDFVFSRPPVNVNFQEKIEDFDDAYISYFDDNKSDKKNFDSLFGWITRQVDFKNKKVLDVGCGSGKFVNYLREKSIDAIGLEPSKPLFDRYLKGKDYFSNSPIEAFVKTAPGKYQVVTLFDVLEHIDYPAAFIENISKLQSANDHLLIEIPLYGSYPSLIMGKKWHFFHNYHLSYFRKKNLKSLLKKNGYEYVSGKYRGKYFVFKYLLQYGWHYIFRKNLKLPGFLSNSYIYINTYDIYIACFKKTA